MAPPTEASLPLTKVMAVELAAAGIRVKCRRPGSCQDRDGATDARYGTAEEIASVVVFLLDDRFVELCHRTDNLADGGFTALGLGRAQ